MAEGSALPGISGVDYFVPNAAQMNYYHSKKLDFLRLPIKWERVQPVLGGPLDSTYSTQILSTFTLAAANGQKILLDIHNFGGYCYTAHSVCGQVGAVGGPTIAQFADLWGRLAQLVGGNAGLIGYDLMNEPNTMPNANVVPQMYQAATISIRVHDTLTAIYLEGDAYAGAFAWNGDCAQCGGAPIGGWNPGGNADLLTVVDPNNNLVFSAHAYADYNSSGSYPVYPGDAQNPGASVCTPGADTYVCATQMGDQLTVPTSTLNTNILVKRFTVFANWCNLSATRLKGSCHLGESGVPRDDANWLTTLDNGMAYLQGNGIRYTYWNADGISTNYPLNVDPQVPGCLTNGTPCFDEPQMAVLTKYTNAAVPTNYQILGPQRGTAGSPSSNFTLNYFGYVTSPFVLTPNDNGSGGTFVPTSITCNIGFNCSGTFTVNESATDVFAISSTNNISFSNPSPLGYSTISDQFLMAGLSNSQIVNVFSSCKIYAPYIGPVYNLRRSSDNATLDFNFTSIHLGACVDQTAIATWAGASNVFVVKEYDQGPNVNNSTLTSGIDGPPPTNADEPQLILNGQNSIATSRWLTNRMQFNSPINGNSAQTILTVYRPTNYMGNNLLDWVFCCGQTATFGFSSDLFNGLSSSSRVFGQSGLWQAVGSTFRAGTANSGLQYRDQTAVGRNGGGSGTINYPFRNNAYFGWQAFVSSPYAGDLGELVVLNKNLTGAQMASFQADEDTRWGISAFPSYSWVAPTLQQNIGSANDPPWAGVNESGIAAGGGFSNLSSPCSPVLGTNGQCPWNLPMGSGTGTYWATRGFNLVRLSVTWEALQPNLCTGNTTINASQLTQVDNAISELTSAGIDALIDMHNFGGYSYSKWGTCASPPDDGNFTRTTTGGYFVNFWTQMATHYASNSKVHFDLMNEPAGTAAALQVSVEQSAITAIRGQSFTGYITPEFGASFASCQDVVSATFTASITGTVMTVTAVTSGTISNGHGLVGSGVTPGTTVVSRGTGTGGTGTYNISVSQTVGSERMDTGNSGPAFMALTDSSNKLVLQCHAYLQPTNNDTGFVAQQGAATARFGTATTGATGFFNTYGIHGLWGEFNITWDPSMYSAVKDSMDLMQANSSAWYGWTEFAAGPWVETYVGKIQPNSNASPYADRPMMRLLNTYATGGTWPATQTFTNCFSNGASCTVNFP